MLDIILPTFATLFVMIDPIGLAPLFIALTAGASMAEKRRIALRGALVGASILLVFGLAGDALLAALGVGMPAFRIAGGVMLFLIAVEMLFEKRSQRRKSTLEQGEAAHAPGHDPSVFPLATPLIAGPGAMAAMVLLMGEHQGDMGAQAVVIAVMLFVVAVTLGLFLLATSLERFFGPTLINVITRILGVLLGALATQFILDGLSSYLTLVEQSAS